MLEMADQLAQIADCSFKKASDLAGGVGGAGVDPRADAIFQSVYGITPATDPASDQMAVSASERTETGPPVVTVPRSLMKA